MHTREDGQEKNQLTWLLNKKKIQERGEMGGGVGKESRENGKAGAGAIFKKWVGRLWDKNGKTW